jgi:hypothetical protein
MRPAVRVAALQKLHVDRTPFPPVAKLEIMTRHVKAIDHLRTSVNDWFRP